MTSGVLQGTLGQARARQDHGVWTASVFGRRNIAVCGGLLAGAYVALLLFEMRLHVNPVGVSATPHYILQAEAFLHGHWYLDVAHAQLWDTVVLHGKTYIIYPPFPALLMLPIVAVFGSATSDVLITTVLSALNLPLLYLLFEQARANGLTRRPWYEHVIISVLLFYGSINLCLSLDGQVWFTAQIICLTFTTLSLLMALRRHFAWSAVLLGCAIFTRGTLALGLPLLFFLVWQNGGTEHLIERFGASVLARTPDWTAIPWRRFVAPAAITVALVALFMARDYFVFGSPLESGYGVTLRQNYPTITHGLYNLAYFRANLMANFFDFPRIMFASPTDLHPQIDMLNQGNGISVFLTTPLFLLLFARNSRFSLMRAALWGTLAIFVVEVLLFSATGATQFGARYLFDAYPYAFLLLALTDVRVDWRFVALGLVALPINVLGAHQFWTHRIISF